MAKLGEVATFYTGTAFPKELQGNKTGKIPFYKVGDISKNVLAGHRRLTLCDNYVEKDVVKKIKGNIVPKDTVVFAKIGEAVKLNRRAITNQDCLVDNNVMGIAPIKSVMDIDYLYYYMCFIKLDKLAESTTVPSVKKGLIENLNINLHNLDIQKRISKVLSGIDDLIQLRKKQLNALDLLVKSRFIEMFGDPVLNTKGLPVKKLKQLTLKISSGNTPKGGREVYVSKGITFFRSQNVWRNYFDMSDVAYIDEATHKKMADTSLKHGDLLITKTGRFNTENSSLGRTALFLGEDDSANINGHVYLVRLKPGINKKFVLHILISNQFRDLIRKVCVGGIDKRQLNKNHIEDFPIIIPALAQQEKYADFITQVDKSKLAIQQSLEKLEALKKSLMQEYFG